MKIKGLLEPEDIIPVLSAETKEDVLAELAAKVSFHMPDEKQKRHGQAMAAASLPVISPLSSA